LPALIDSALDLTGFAIFAFLSGTGHGFGSWFILNARLRKLTAIIEADKINFCFIELYFL
jgi:hypothetical protein